MRRMGRKSSIFMSRTGAEGDRQQTADGGRHVGTRLQRSQVPRTYFAPPPRCLPKPQATMTHIVCTQRAVLLVPCHAPVMARTLRLDSVSEYVAPPLAPTLTLKCIAWRMSCLLGQQFSASRRLVQPAAFGPLGAEESGRFGRQWQRRRGTRPRLGPGAERLRLQPGDRQLPGDGVSGYVRLAELL